MLDSFSPNQHYALQFVHPPANVEHIKCHNLDLPYAHLSSAEKLDIYLPDDGEGPFPLIISIHGGAFMGVINPMATSYPCWKVSNEGMQSLR